MKPPIPFYFLGLAAAALAIISVAGAGPSFYSSLPMIALWGICAVTAAIVMVRRRLYRRPAIFGVHIAFLIILAGALTTHILGTSRTISLAPGQTTLVGEQTVELLSFDIRYYPGTCAPCDFVSRIRVDADTATVAMNSPADVGAYRYFQSAWNPATGQTTLTVSADRTGTAISYTGYAILFISMFLSCLRLPRFLRLRGMAAVAGISVAAAANASPQAIPADVAESMADIFVYHNDRPAPLSAAARDFTIKLTGKAGYAGLSPVQVLTGWLFYYDSWRSEPCILIKEKASRNALGLDGKRAALPDFFAPDGTYLLAGEEHSAANERFALASTAAAGSLWKIFPAADGSGGAMAWYSPVDELPADLDVADWHLTRHSLGYLAELAQGGRWEDFRAAVEKIKSYQHAKVPVGLPTPPQIWSENMFVGMASSAAPMAVFILAGLVLFFASAPRVTLWAAVAGAAWVAWLIVLNAYASQKLPFSNGYETMQWIALCAFVFGATMWRRNTSLSAIGILVGGLALLVAFMSVRNPRVTALVPVLRSPLLSIHVLAVVLAYAMLAVCALCSVAWFIGRPGLLSFARKALRPAVFMLAFGIFIGAVWANQSWGRYWGWDPKEVWALITMIIYSFALHPGALPAFRRDRFFALWCSLAFISVLVTYFGVNYLMGGLHSYA